ncbi:MAG: alanine racemase [Acidobacteriota bacterium]
MVSTPSFLPPEADREADSSPRGLSGALRPAWVEVDLDALVGNFERLRRTVAPSRVMAVLKADAYGHGAPFAARALARAGVDWIAVALLEEGAELRRAGVEQPILVLGTAQRPQLPLYRRYSLTPTLSSLDQIDLWRAFGEEVRRRQPVHLKVDTGMNRLGVATDQIPRALELLRSDRHLELSGLITHFAEADTPASPSNAAQQRRFEAVLDQLTAAERSRLLIHAANSAAGLHHPASRHQLVRFGLALFGLDPADREAARGAPGDLEPVMSVVTRIVQRRTLEAGAAVGYGGRWRAERPSEIAVVPVGYADGYAWRLTPGARALVGGTSAPLVGSVTMDMSMIDVTGLGAEVGDEVVLLGRRGDHAIDAWDLAESAGTIPWEMLCLLGLRMPRRYRSEGRIEEVSARFSSSRGQGLW